MAEPSPACIPVRPNRERCRAPERVAAVAAVLLGCLPIGGASARAQDAAQTGSFDGLLGVLHLKGHAAPAPAFVTQSRPRQEQDFIPVGTPHADRPVKVMSAAEVAATESALDAARVRQQIRAGQRPAAVPLKQQDGAKSAKNTVP